MNIKEKICRTIHDTVSNYDFENAIENAIEDIDIEELIINQLNLKIDRIDVKPLLTDLINDYIDRELDEIDIEDEVLTAVQDAFEEM